MSNIIEQSILKVGKSKEVLQKKYATAKAKYDAKIAELAAQFQTVTDVYEVEKQRIDSQIEKLKSVCNPSITEETELYLMEIDTLPTILLEKKEKKVKEEVTTQTEKTEVVTDNNLN